MDIIKFDAGRAVKAIVSGKILICPTDTVYGLVCDAGNRQALKRLYEIKKRHPKKPVPLFVCDIKTAKKLASIGPEQEEYLKKVWPGKVTAVLKKKQGRGTVGLRIPRHAFLLALLRRVKRPLTGTSANIAGRPASTRIREVIGQFDAGKDRPDLIIDAGNLPESRPSRVIDLTLCPPKTLRY